MAIFVRAGSSTHIFSDARKVDVRDAGHLYVIGDGNRTIGVFSPGKWDYSADADAVQTKKGSVVVA